MNALSVAAVLGREAGEEFFSCRGTGDVAQHRCDTLTAALSQCCLTPGVQQSPRNHRMTESFWLEKAFQIIESDISLKENSSERCTGYYYI